MTRPHVLILQHVAWEQPAVLGEVLTASGIDWTLDTVVSRRELPPEREITGFDGLVLLGGPMGALDVEEHPGLGLEAQLVRDATVLGIPVFGICLGHQLIATALGATLHSASAHEVGVGDVELLVDGELGMRGEQVPVLHWHGDVVEAPHGATVLASSPSTPNQAFRIDDRVFATQFHLEVDPATLDHWLEEPAMLRDLPFVTGTAAEAADRLRAELAAIAEPMRAAGERLFGAFADAVLRRTSVDPSLR
ncbi:type 1 glutamine amidotransferase [Plantibacter sp. VKM Ac-2880]|uniref:type 1 glutamine amidotransferase n=1 Tax=Plantibacter sp. VKM Ac-2880 TaxID=2783827 RepID=UPI00189093D9|nr:type 1 glutamine amidotransferase [Plantibacter sp. VKM Ac-2880]MBF4567939.1 type 1 glutamine amidotransferase [Plantibacter sp. VKM Ac-2880]